MKKISFCLIMVFCLMFNNMVFASFEDFVPDPVDTTPKLPTINLIEPQTISLANGEEKAVDILFKNTAVDNAMNVFFDVKAGDAPFTVEVLNRSNVKKSLGYNTGYYLKLNLIADSNAKSGTYPISINVTYYNSEEESFSGSFVTNVKLTGVEDASKPVIVAKNIVSSPSAIKNGEAFLLKGMLGSTKGVAKNIQVKLSNLSSDTFTLNNGDNPFVVDEILEGEEAEFSFPLKANSKLKAGNYDINMDIVYYDEEGTSYTSTYSYSVSVTNSFSSGKVNIAANNVAGTKEVDTSFTVTGKITNNNTEDIKNITLSATPNDSASIVPTSSNTIIITNLAKGETRDFEFSFKANKTAVSQNYVIEIKSSYKYASGDTEALENIAYSSVNIYNTKLEEEEDETADDEKKSVPKIIISDYSIEPEVVYAGTPFKLTFDLLNTSSDRSVKNIKAALVVNTEETETGNVFTPVNGSNSIYIDSIGAGSTVQKYIELQPDYNATAKNYDINIAIEYEDEDNNAYTQNEIVGVKVNQVVKLEYSDIISPDFMAMGDYGSVSFQFYNTGKVPLNNLRMKVIPENLDNFDVSESETFFGRFEIGSSEYFDGQFSSTGMGEAGTQNLKVLITYEDENGLYIEETKDFTVELEEAYVEEFADGAMMEEVPAESSIPIKPIIIVVAVIAAIGLGFGGFKFYKHKKSKKDGFYE